MQELNIYRAQVLTALVLGGYSLVRAVLPASVMKSCVHAPMQHWVQEKERIVTNLREVMGVSEQRHREIRTDIEAERK